MVLAGQRDADFGPPHLDVADKVGDQLEIIGWRIGSDAPPDRIDNDGFDLGRGDAGDRPGGLRPSLDQGGRYVIAVPRRALPAVTRAHAVAAVIKDASCQKGYRARPRRAIAAALLHQLSLNGLEQVTIEDRRMLCWTDLALEDDLADIEPVAQEIGERASGEGDAADGPPIREMAFSKLLSSVAERKQSGLNSARQPHHSRGLNSFRMIPLAGAFAAREAPPRGRA